MIQRSIFLSLTAAFGLVALAFASAQETNNNSLTIDAPTIRGTIQTAKVAAGYLTITNNGSEDDRLLSANVSFAKEVQVHTMKVSDGIMTMRPLKAGLIVPAGGTVVLKRGAEHLMFMKLKEPMLEGETRMVTLEFEKAGTVEVMFSVGNIAGDPVDHSGHDDHSTQNSHSGHTN